MVGDRATDLLRSDPGALERLDQACALDIAISEQPVSARRDDAARHQPGDPRRGGFRLARQLG